MKKAAICVGLVFGLLSAASAALAWDVTVENPTEYKARIRYYVNKDGKCISNYKYDVEPGATRTWKTKAACPASLKGKILIKGQWYKIQSVGCAGREISEDACGGICCWNIKFAVCQKAGFGYDEPRHYDYSFCKK